MTHEWEIRAALATEFGDAVRYCRPWWGRDMRQRLDELDAAGRRGERLTVLVPARTETGWFQDVCFSWEVRFFRGRVILDGYKSGAPFPSAVVVIGPGARRGEVIWWEIPRAQLELGMAA